MSTLRKHRCLAVLAMWLLLLGTAVPALERLNCSMGCPSTVGFGSIEDCCADEHTEHGSALMAGDCCDVERMAPEHHAFTTDKASIHFELLANSFERGTLAVPQAIGHVPGGTLSTRPPPLLTTERLSRVGHYLI